MNKEEKILKYVKENILNTMADLDSLQFECEYLLTKEQSSQDIYWLVYYLDGLITRFAVLEKLIGE